MEGLCIKVKTTQIKFDLQSAETAAILKGMVVLYC